MCGRYALARNRRQLQLEFDLAELDSAAETPSPRSWPPLEELRPDYNIAPGKPVYAVLGAPPAESGERSPGPSSLCTLRWGLVPSWAKDPNVGYRMINARSETVADKPAFRTAFTRRRCLLPADAYYEWQLLPKDAPGTTEASTSPATDPAHRKRKARADKRPFAVRYRDGAPLAMAGLFERWRDPTREEDDPRAWLWSCAVITTDAAPGLDHIHERMPVVVPRADWSTWLDPAADRATLAEVMAHTPAEGLESYPVGRAVNSARNNGPELLEPEPEPGPPTTLF